MNRKYIWICVLGVFWGCASPSDQSPDLSNFQIQEGFQITLIASEPQVMDPVAMEIDEEGNFYVVEMPGYPMDVTGSGRVKLLKDIDGDGVMDESQIFAEGLVLPNGIMRWKNGVIVTDASGCHLPGGYRWRWQSRQKRGIANRFFQV